MCALKFSYMKHFYYKLIFTLTLAENGLMKVLFDVELKNVVFVVSVTFLSNLTYFMYIS